MEGFIGRAKRPGRDKESRMRDLSEEESSGDSDIPVLEKDDMPGTSYSSQGVESDTIKTKSAKDSQQSREKDSSPYKFDKNQTRKNKKERRHSSSSSSSVECVSEKKVDTEKGKKSDAHRVSSNGLKLYKPSEKIPDSSDSSSSSDGDLSPKTRESKREGRLKAKQIKEAIIKRIFAKKGRDTIMVSIDRKNYETSSRVGESQKRHSSNSESEDVAIDLSKDTNSKTKTLKDVPKLTEDERNIEENALSFAETSVTDPFEQSESLQKRYSSDSRSSSRSNDSSAKESNSKNIHGNEAPKSGIKLQGQVRDSNIMAVGERGFRYAKKRDSSDDSSSSDRSRYRGRKVEREKPMKETPSKGDKNKSSEKLLAIRKHKKRGSSASSSSSSSSSSGTSSSSSTSKTSSVSKGRSSSSSSSSSSTSSSSVRQHKRKFKNKDGCKCRSRSPLKTRKKSNQTSGPKKVHVGNLTKNACKDILYEIFSLYGVVKNVDVPLDKYRAPRGFAYVEYDKAEDAEKAVYHMNGGIFDGQKIKVAPVLPFKPRIPMRRISPNRRPFGGNWRYTPPFRSRGGGSGSRDWRRRMRSPPRRRSPRRRTRSRSPIRRRRMRHNSRSSSR